MKSPPERAVRTPVFMSFVLKHTGITLRCEFRGWVRRYGSRMLSISSHPNPRLLCFDPHESKTASKRHIRLSTVIKLPKN